MGRRRKGKSVQVASPLVKGEKRAIIAFVPIIFLVFFVSTACLAYLWFSSHVSGNVQPAAGQIPNAVASTSGFQPTVENRERPPGPSPKGMVWIPGGEYSMGANDPPDMDDVGMTATLDARPIHRVYVDGFYMDKTDVTNAQFAEFVKATRYVTVAERTPRAEDFPGAPPENLVAGGVVFSPPDHAVPLNNHLQWWSYVKEANWRHPSGPKSNIQGKEK